MQAALFPHKISSLFKIFHFWVIEGIENLHYDGTLRHEYPASECILKSSWNVGLFGIWTPVYPIISYGLCQNRINMLRTPILLGMQSKLWPWAKKWLVRLYDHLWHAEGACRSGPQGELMGERLQSRPNNLANMTQPLSNAQRWMTFIHI